MIRARSEAACMALSAIAILAMLASAVGCGPRAAARQAVAAAAAEGVHAGETPRPAAASLPRVLVFSRTLGFRHKSIPDGIAALREIGTGCWEVDATEDPAAFGEESLRRYRAVVFLSTTGDVLDAAQQRALEAYVRSGGGWAGVHAAADTEYGWPWYGRMAGAWFAGHPKVQPATVRVEDLGHPSTSMLPPEWVRTDEWYSFRSNPRGGVRVLATLDERTYDPERTPMGADHPIAWCHEFEGGRAWYTGGGHTAESFREPLFREHLRGGIEWAMGIAAAGPRAARTADAAVAQAALAQSPVRQEPSVAGVPLGIVKRFGPFAAMVAVAVAAGMRSGNLKAPLCALLFPGLGHLVLGYRRRGLLAMAGVLGMFVTGLLVGGVDAVDHDEDAPWFIAQSMNGPIALGADLANQEVLRKGKAGELLPAPASPDPFGRPLPAPAAISSLKAIGAANEFGTLFIALGGMLNLVLVLDAGRREPASAPDA